MKAQAPARGFLPEFDNTDLEIPQAGRCAGAQSMSD